MEEGKESDGEEGNWEIGSFTRIGLLRLQAYMGKTCPILFVLPCEWQKTAHMSPY